MERTLKILPIFISFFALILSAFGIYHQFLKPAQKEVYITLTDWRSGHDFRPEISDQFSIDGYVRVLISNTGEVPLLFIISRAEFEWGRQPAGGSNAFTSYSARCNHEAFSVEPSEIKTIELACSNEYEHNSFIPVFNRIAFFIVAQDPLTGKTSSASFRREFSSQKESNGVGAYGDSTKDSARLNEWSDEIGDSAQVININQ